MNPIQRLRDWLLSAEIVFWQSLDCLCNDFDTSIAIQGRILSLEERMKGRGE